jgi:hypothetical protein
MSSIRLDAFVPLRQCLENIVPDPIGADGHLAYESRGEQRAKLRSQVYTGLQQRQNLSEPGFVTLQSDLSKDESANLHKEFRRQFGQKE